MNVGLLVRDAERGELRAGPGRRVHSHEEAGRFAVCALTYYVLRES